MEKNNKTFDIYISHLQRQLLKELGKSEKVFIVPHIRMDYDALASATALYYLCNKLNIEAYIVTNDIEENMKPNLQLMVKNIKRKYKFINTNELKELKSDNDLVILTDVNSTALIPIEDINNYKRIVIIDHHEPDHNLVNTNKIFINTSISSASEITYYLLKSLNMYISSSLAQRLLTGIYLDTNGLYTIKNSNTFMTVHSLINEGANLHETQQIFIISDFNEDRKYHEGVDCLIDNTKFYTEISNYNIAISMNNENPNTIYTHEQLVDAAVYLLKFDLDAAFAIGFVDREELGEGHKNIIAVKARSNMNTDEEIDVNRIMKILHGGGDKNRAACLIESDDIYAVKRTLKEITIPGASLGHSKTFKKVL